MRIEHADMLVASRAQARSLNVIVFGLGYVGMTSAACLAYQGHKVTGIDINGEKIAAVNSGCSPVTEPGLSELVERGVAAGRLNACEDFGAAIADADIAIVCVGTPSLPDGSHNMNFIAEVSRQIAAAIDRKRGKPLTIVYRSTFRPGTMDDLIVPIFREALGEDERSAELVYHPEFLREACAIDDFFNPPKIVVGTRDGKPSANIAALCTGLKAPTFVVRYREAELTKFVDNSFHAMKVVFANEIGRVCQRLGVSARAVHEIFVADTKLNISPRYLRPGGAFGGSCLPKDIRALQHIADDAGAHTHLVNSLLRSNEAHKNFLFELCTRGLNEGARVLMIGLAFKPESDDVRESPNIDLARRLLQASFALSIYDPHLEPAHLLGQNLGYAFSSLPTLRRLLISEETLETEQFDLVIDNRGWAKELGLRAQRVVDINALA